MAEELATTQHDPGAKLQALQGVRRKQVTGTELRTTSLPTQSLGGYRRESVDELLDEAAASLDDLGERVASLNDELRRAKAVEPVPESVVTQILVTAQRVVEETQEGARLEAAELVAHARAEFERAEQLHREAQAMLDGARAEANAIIVEARPAAAALTAAAQAEAAATLAAAQGEAERLTASARVEAETVTASARAAADALTSEAQAEHDRVMASSTEDAEAARAALETELLRIDGAIDDLRRTWSERLTNALANLNAPPQETQPAPDVHAHAHELAEQANDLASELQELANEATGTQSQSAEEAG
jgi:cell division septum initiation protein DivIVA